MNHIPPWVKLGANVTLEDNVRLGVGKEEFGDLIIGDNSKIRSGTVIYRGTTIGKNFQTGHNVVIREKNNLGEYNCVGSFSELAPENNIGSYNSIHSQCFLECVTLGNFIFVAPGVRFLDDLLPIDTNAENYKGATVYSDTAIGGGSVILPGVFIGSKVLIGGGSVVTKNVPDGQVWVGNPAKFLKCTRDLKYPNTNETYLPGTRKRYEK